MSPACLSLRALRLCVIKFLAKTQSLQRKAHNTPENFRARSVAAKFHALDSPRTSGDNKRTLRLFYFNLFTMSLRPSAERLSEERRCTRAFPSPYFSSR
jgi:hypothetical protein